MEAYPDKVDEQPVTGEAVQDKIAEYVLECWRQSVDYRQQYVDNDMLEADRRINGEYDPSTSAAIRASGYPVVFDNITKVKSSSAVSWLLDLLPPNKPLFEIRATPIPSLPNDAAESIVNDVVAEVQASAIPMDPTSIRDRALEIYDDILAKTQEEANLQAIRAGQKIHDIMVEGGFREAFSDFIEQLSRRPSAFLKAELRNVERVVWNEKGDAEAQPEVIWQFDSPDPIDVYTGPNARRLDETFVCEEVRFRACDLALCIGTPGWVDKNIRELLQEKPSPIEGKTGQFSGFAQQQGRDTQINDGNSPDVYPAIMWQGKIPSYRLKDHDIKLNVKDDYQVSAKIIIYDKKTLFVQINPDPMNRIPFWGTSFFKKENSIWGSPLALEMKESQDIVNMLTRAVVYNAMASASFHTSVDVNMLLDDEIPNVHSNVPGKVWPFDGRKSNNARDPIQFKQPELTAPALMNVRAAYKDEADDHVLIPRYAYGDQSATGAATTASGLAMLMSNAMKVIRRVLLNIDRDVVIPLVSYLYDYHLLAKDPLFQGDVQIEPAGVFALILRETKMSKLIEALQLTAQVPEDMMIVGVEGRRKMLEELFVQLDMPRDIIPSEAVLMERVAQQQQQQEQEQAMMPQEEENDSIVPQSA